MKAEIVIEEGNHYWDNYHINNQYLKHEEVPIKPIFTRKEDILDISKVT